MLAIFTAEPLLAEMYKYTDSRGDVHYVDDLGRVPKRYRAKARTLDDLPPISVMDATPVPAKKRPSVDTGSQTKPRERFSGTVELYMTSWCGYCRKAEQYLKQKGIAYTAFDIEKDESAKRRYRELGGTGGVPLIQIGANQIRGYSPEAIDRYTGK
jgi:glutaredoxin-like YruB-family protein